MRPNEDTSAMSKGDGKSQDSNVIQVINSNYISDALKQNTESALRQWSPGLLRVRPSLRLVAALNHRVFLPLERQLR
jgi:hypothetical protein